MGPNRYPQPTIAARRPTAGWTPGKKSLRFWIAANALSSGGKPNAGCRFIDARQRAGQGFGLHRRTEPMVRGRRTQSSACRERAHRPARPLAEASPPLPAVSPHSRGGGWWLRLLSCLCRRSHGSFGKTHQPPSGTRPANTGAEDLYLQGRFYWNKRTPESCVRRSIFRTSDRARPQLCAVIRGPGGLL